MIYEFISTENPFTLKADNPKIAEFCMPLLGEGKYIMAENYNEFVMAHKKEIIDCLNSVMVGDKIFRLESDKVDEAITTYMTSEDKENYRRRLLESKQFSLNEIDRTAWRLAKEMEIL